SAPRRKGLEDRAWEEPWASGSDGVLEGFELKIVLGSSFMVLSWRSISRTKNEEPRTKHTKRPSITPSLDYSITPRSLRLHSDALPMRSGRSKVQQIATAARMFFAACNFTHLVSARFRPSLGLAGQSIEHSFDFDSIVFDAVAIEVGRNLHRRAKH